MPRLFFIQFAADVYSFCNRRITDKNAGIRNAQANSHAAGFAKQAPKYPHKGTNQNPTIVRAIISATPANIARPE